MIPFSEKSKIQTLVESVYKSFLALDSYWVNANADKSDELQELFSTAYPFEGDFHELTFGVNNWMYNINSVIEGNKELFTKFQNSKVQMSVKQYMSYGEPEESFSDINSTVFSYAVGYIEVLPTGKFYLFIERSEYESENLQELEEILFDWAVYEGLQEELSANELALAKYVPTIASILFSYGWYNQSNGIALSYLNDFAERNDHAKKLYTDVFLTHTEAIVKAVNDIPKLESF